MRRRKEEIKKTPTNKEIIQNSKKIGLIKDTALYVLDNVNKEPELVEDTGYGTIELFYNVEDTNLEIAFHKTFIEVHSVKTESTINTKLPYNKISQLIEKINNM